MATAEPRSPDAAGSVSPDPADGHRSPEAWARVSTLFDAALELPVAERGAWLAQIAATEPEVVPWLRSLLEAHSDTRNDGWLENGLALTWPVVAASDGFVAGARVGPWTLVAPLGRGGMGEVWRASRADGAYQREVALKLPLNWRPDRAAAQRFERERDILARLEHPHIARLYDANVADDGTPWLAIEQVDGVPLDAWCRERRLTLSQRLRLFLQVLDAVQYAHARLVLHRDLKPSNILVTPEGQVKLLDFGIATVLQAAAPTTASELTQRGGAAMTPAYAAPEQVAGAPLTTATDLYAAGVVLFELLTGVRPYGTAVSTPAQLEAAILQGEVRRPSEAADAALAAAIGLPLKQLRRRLAGDLDVILGQALNRDPARRYGSAQALADDLDRHLRGHPVLAQRESMVYVWRKFVARHRTVVATAVMGVLALAVGLGAAVWQGRQAAEQRDRAVASRAYAVATSAFVEDLLNDAVRAGRPIVAEEWLARAETMARRTFARQPDQLASVLWMVSQRASAWDGHARARSLLQEALGLARDPDLRDQLTCSDAYGQAQVGQLAEARQRLQALADGPRVQPAARACALGFLAFMTSQAGRPPDAVALQRRALAQIEVAPFVAPHERALMQARLGLYLGQSGQGDESDRLYAQALAVMRDGGRERSESAWAMRNEWAIALNTAGDARAAWPLAQDNLRIVSEDAAGTPLWVYNLRNAGLLALTLGRFDEAAALIEQGLAAARSQGSGSAEFHRALECDRSLVATRGGQLALAAEALQRAERIERRASASDAFYDVGCRLARAEHDLARAAPAEAAAVLGRLLTEPAAQAAGFESAARVLSARAQLGLGDQGKALADAERALALARRLQGARPHSWRTGVALLAVASVRSAQGRHEEARAGFTQAAEQLAATVDDTNPWLQEARRRAAAPPG